METCVNMGEVLLKRPPIVGTLLVGPGLTSEHLALTLQPNDQTFTKRIESIFMEKSNPISCKKSFNGYKNKKKS